MTFRYDSQNIAGPAPIPEGEHDVYIASATEKISKSSGKPMVEIVYHVTMPDGGERKVWDYIVDSNVYKLRDIAEAVGSSDSFASNVFDASAYVMKNLIIKIKHKPDRASGEIRPNVVGYAPSKLTSGKPTPAKPLTQDATVTEDDIPF